MTGGHTCAQIVGKIRLAASPRRNHWWNVPFHLTGRGITTRPMGLHPIVTVDFDFVDHRLIITALDGRTVSFPLAGQSVVGFYRRTLDGLAAVGAAATIDHPQPFDLPDSGRLFAEDTEHTRYDPAWVNRYWQVLSQGQPGARGVRRPLLGQDQSGAPLLAQLRHRCHPLQ